MRGRRRSAISAPSRLPAAGRSGLPDESAAAAPRAGPAARGCHLSSPLLPRRAALRPEPPLRPRSLARSDASGHDRAARPRAPPVTSRCRGACPAPWPSAEGSRAEPSPAPTCPGGAACCSPGRRWLILLRRRGGVAETPRTTGSAPGPTVAPPASPAPSAWEGGASCRARAPPSPPLAGLSVTAATSGSRGPSPTRVRPSTSPARAEGRGLPAAAERSGR